MRRVFYAYSDKFLNFKYGEGHPLKVYRLLLAKELSRLYGLLDDITIEEPQPCSEDDILGIHSPEYLATLKQSNNGIAVNGIDRFHLGIDDNPIFEGVFDWASLLSGASLAGAKRIVSGEADIYFNPSGGFHHGMPEKAAGFCYLNDIAIAIKYLVDKGKKVLYVDTDAHHGDAVQHIFYKTHKVMTVSFHESGRFAFPGTGYENEIGEGDGLGFCANFPIYPYCDDTNYLRAFFELLPPIVNAFRPDVLVTQLGADSMRGDPLATLNLSTSALEKIFSYYRELNLPWLALGGGGYNPFNVARAWTLALATMTGKAIADPIPASFFETTSEFGVFDGSLRDSAPYVDEKYANMIDRETTRIMEKLKKHLFPHHFLY